MEAIQSLTHYNWFVVVSAIIVAMAAFKFLSDLFEWFVKKFGIETKSMREKRESKECLDKTTDLAKKTAENLATLQERHAKDEKEFRRNLERHMTESEKDRKALHSEMKQYSDNRVKDREQSLRIQKELNSSIDKLTSMFLDKEIDDMRWEILNFCSALSNGRKYNRESYDHVFRVYEKYENILKENEMENGLVEESIGYIREVYREGLKEGIIK